MSVNYDVICDELHIEADSEVQAIVSTKEIHMSPKASFIGERKKRQQAAGYSALKSLTTDIEAIDSPADKVVLNQEWCEAVCELLGMSANVPTDICFSFSGLMQRGGGTGPHRDGWGIAFYEGKGLRCFHDPAPSVDSAIARLIKDQPIKSHVVISHIRQANVGDVNLANTHPFTRELWGYTWTFAHNGQLDKVLFDLPLKFYEPVGTTDSEYAFCWLLGNIRERFPVRPDNPDKLKLFIQSCCEQLRELGVFNMLLTESTYLFAYCTTKLSWITRKAPFGEASLTDCELTVDFYKETTPNDIVTVIATEPLTANEAWSKLKTGEMITFADGLPV